MVLTGLLVFALLSLAFGTAVLVLGRRPSQYQTIRKIFLLMATIGATALIGEFLLAFVFIYPDGWGQTLASDRWTQLYWHPINRQGYRDIDHESSDFKGKRVVFAVGDSFTAGAGVNDYRDRFSNRLQDKLGDSWLVINIAVSGWSTPDENEAISEHPHVPDVIILSYYLNDIKKAARKSGVPMREAIPLPAGLMGRLLRQSYLSDFLYWRLYRSLMSEEMADWWDAVDRCYSDPATWAEHSQELLDIVAFSQQNQIKLVAVVFPELSDVARSRPYTGRVVRLLKTVSVPVLDMAEVLKDRPPEELVANNIDSHPNEEVHGLVADLLFRLLEQVNPAQERP